MSSKAGKQPEEIGAVSFQEEVVIVNQSEEPHQDTRRTWREEFDVAGSQLVERVKELLNESNVRRLIIRYSDNRVLLDIPLTVGAAGGGVLIVFAPVLTAVAAIAALVAHARLEVVRVEDEADDLASHEADRAGGESK